MATTTSPVCSKSPAYLLIILHQTTQYMYLPLGNPYNQSKAHICVPLARLSLLHSALRPYQVYSTSLPLCICLSRLSTNLDWNSKTFKPSARPTSISFLSTLPYQHATTTTLMIVHNLEDILGNVNDPASLPARFYLSVRPREHTTMTTAMYDNRPTTKLQKSCCCSSPSSSFVNLILRMRRTDKRASSQLRTRENPVINIYSEYL